ncbi:MAG: tetratricopeptide repeat protein [Mariniblastus sp.]
MKLNNLNHRNMESESKFMCHRKCPGFILALTTLVVIGFLVPGNCLSQDSVFTFRKTGGSKVNGRITAMSPEGITIGGKTIPADDVRKISFSKEPKEISRARDQMDAGRFADSIEEIGKVQDVSSPLVKQEVDFIKAYSTARLSLGTGSVSPQVAGVAVRDFINQHPDSIHYYPAVEQFGHLLFAFGKPEMAVGNFEKLTQSNWLEYKLRGYFWHGEMLMAMGKYAEAQKSFEALIANRANDDISQSYKLLGKCLQAKAIGMQGDSKAAIATLQGIVRDENPDKKKLFAHLYNALGALHEKEGNSKEAALAYLHTQLLFSSEAEPHSEALYRLALIWRKLEETDRANESLDNLKSAYRNSYWAGKL